MMYTVGLIKNLYRSLWIRPEDEISSTDAPVPSRAADRSLATDERPDLPITRIFCCESLSSGN
ncbi:MAG: hypothetical protein IJR16_05160 [Spirochaetales bacterium]|nr:hypothetical protein [Spirochaetales bacterium]